MLGRGLVLLVLLFAGAISTGCTSEKGSGAAGPFGPSSWQFAFANDGQGKDLQGSRSALLASIRRGSPVRVGWSESSSKENWSVEEFSDEAGDPALLRRVRPPCIDPVHYPHRRDAAREHPVHHTVEP